MSRYTVINNETRPAVDWYNGLPENEQATVDGYVDNLHKHFVAKHYRPLLGDSYKLELVYKVYPFINKRDK